MVNVVSVTGLEDVVAINEVVVNAVAEVVASVKVFDVASVIGVEDVVVVNLVVIFGISFLVVDVA